MRFRRRRPEQFDLEDELRAVLPQAPEHFVRAAKARLDGAAVRRRLALRLALAAVLTLAMLLAVISVGGLGQAGSNTSDFGNAIGSIFLTSGSANGEDDDDDDHAGEDQYCEEDDDDGGGGGDDDDGGGGGDDDDGGGDNGGGDNGGSDGGDDDDGGGDDDDGGGNDDDCVDEDEDKGEDECTEREEDLRARQTQERAALEQHQQSAHPRIPKRSLPQHFQQEQQALTAQQAQENRELDDDCGED